MCKVQQAGRLVDQITPTSASNMFETVADEFSGGRNVQKKWNTVAHELRKANQNVARHASYACLGGGGGGLILPINCGGHARMSGWWWAQFGA